jgi:hypothetical protein
MRKLRRADWVNALILSGIIGIGGFSFGCTTSLSPLNPEDITLDNPGAGLVFGQIHLVYNGKDLRTGLRYPVTLAWWMSDDPQGRSFVVSDLPVDGSFILKLPLGRYNITSLGFRDGLREWTVSLPAVFTVEAGCTYLGTWELRFQAGTFAGKHPEKSSINLSSCATT